MFSRWIVCLSLFGGLLVPLAASALDGAPAAVLPADYKPWPREVTNGAITYRIYEPEAESWHGSDLKFRAAVAVIAESGTRYGIAHGQARTWIESGTGLVKLEGIRIERLNFPTAADGGEAYLRDLQRGASGTWLVRREQLGPSQAAPERVPVRNDPPRIFVSYSPALLVLIDGQPVLRPQPDTSFERVINTRVLLLRDPRAGRYYLHAFDGWLAARDVIGPWQTVSGDTSRLDEVQRRLGSGEVDLLDGGEARPSLRGGAPVVYVSTTPAELIVLTGEPQLEPIAGTQLLWVKNTSAPLLLDTGSDHYYTVISGRWFRAPALNGPWSFAPSDRLPGDVALIPDGHALAPVRAAVPGTPQAQEAVIANSVPQTTTVRRTEARFEPTIDGEPQLRSIEGTALTYVVNSPTPIIRVDADSWYAVDRGVWFTGRGIEGPWQVATWVPPAIYAIPATSPLHYVTYVKVYGATPDEVFTGYTPGYLGAVVAPAGTVVVGTGAYVSPWIGSAWYGTPWTYGCGWSVGVGPFWPTWSPWCSPWWGPAWGGWWRPPVWAWGTRPAWGWGRPPGWGWGRPPAWGWGRPPAWGWGHPGWHGWRPPIYAPPLPRPPVALPPGRPPGVWPPPPGGRPPGAFPPPGGRPPLALPAPVRPQPASPVGPGWGHAVSGRGPGWGGTATAPGLGSPALPQSLRGAPPPALPPRVGGMATPELRTGAPMIAPSSVPRVESIARPLPGGAMVPGFRGAQPVAPPLTSPSPIRGPTGGFPAPGGPAAGFPRFNAPAPAAMPRGYGGMAAPGAPAMAPHLGAPPGAAGGFRGASPAPRGPGWGGPPR